MGMKLHGNTLFNKVGQFQYHTLFIVVSEAYMPYSRFQNYILHNHMCTSAYFQSYYIGSVGMRPLST